MIKFIEAVDLKTFNFIRFHYKKKHMNSVMKFFTFIGDFGLIWLIIAFILFHNENFKGLSLMLFSALILTSVLGEGLIKHIVKRPRPFIKLNAEETLIIKPPITYSFPSGHTASSFACATVFILTGTDFRWIVLSISIMISLSRIYLNVHYLSDVIGGMILGIICGCLSFLIVASIFLI